jgi:hypothetical protein
MRAPQRTLIIDISNILFRVAVRQKVSGGPMGINDLSPEDLVAFCMHMSLQSIYKWFSKIKPDFVVFAFEGGDNWRKKYSAKHDLRRQYKANRVRDPAMDHFYKLIDSFKEIIENHTSVCCLAVEGMEADDTIAAYCQLTTAPDHEIYIVSGDKDFIQLLSDPQVRLINPDTGKLRNQPGDKDYEENLDYWLFLKCVRGDSGDNVPSAYPRVFSTKIREAFDDPYKRLNFMNVKWVDENKIERRVGDLFEHNQVLVALDQQPDDIRVKLLEGTAQQIEKIGNYSHFHFLKFLGEYKLKRVSEEVSKFVAMFTNNQRFRKGEQVSAKEKVHHVTTPAAEVETNTKGLIF